MCGICGFAAFGAKRETPPGAVLAAMTRRLVHRGPDGEGFWRDDDAGIGLGHRRLAILDLSPAGHQPMVSADGRWVICFNGEIYNFQDLRGELEAAGVVFRGRSDTEVLLEGCARWGVDKVAPRLIGIFAFALWDRAERRLVLVRDQMGIKPLYWGWFDGLLLFGSELKALRAHPGWRPEIDRNAVAAFLRFGYVPAPHSIYGGVHKLAPGAVLEVTPGQEPRERRYWDLEQVARAGRATPPPASETEAVDRLEALLRDAIGRQMVADVPLGAFLSGGIDSSTVVALMQAQSSRPVRSFTIGFREQGYDEAAHAKAVAAHLGTDHTELYLDPAQALDVVPRLPEWFDEPFADSSQIPTYLVSWMTRQHVTVALSGDGGDELFAGYNRYLWAERLWRRLGPIPAGPRRLAAAAVQALPQSAWDALFRLVPARRRPAQIGLKLHKLAGVLGLESPDAVYGRLVTHWDAPESLVPGAREPASIIRDPAVARAIPDFTARMQYLDTLTYLPDDILVKVDRASMAVALEARVPLLDPRVVAHAWTLPSHLKQRGGTGKWLLRQVLYRHVPAALIDRPKMGFSIPLDAWLRGPLRDWAEHLLDQRRLTQAGLLNPAPIRGAWADLCAGRGSGQHLLWDVLMLQAWQEQWGM